MVFAKTTGNYLKPPVKATLIWTLAGSNLTNTENCSDKVSMDRPKTITSPETSIIIVDDTQEYALILKRVEHTLKLEQLGA